MRLSKVLFLGLASAFLYVGCKTVPLTGRRQVAAIPNSELVAMASQQYAQVIATGPLSQNQSSVNQVRRVGNRIKTATEKFLYDNGHSELLEGFEWEFNVIAEPTVNAWAMPGGKVAFYEGILPVCKDDAGVAVVMGHEIAHAIASHGNERMTQGLAQQLGAVALSEALSTKPEETQALFLQAYGLGSQVGAILPFSRLQESEADKMGLVFMAMAGYDPRVAPEFWERMSALSTGEAPDELLSTHPSDERRIRELNEYMPEALKYYKN
ncbi:M48 family metallopeptidase [Cryomorphaceae bacterium]|nr:M48 family metallopeptidase [Cryomorphaceae bacterium]